MTTSPAAALTILDHAPAQNAELATSLVGLRAHIRAAAQANVDLAIAGDDSYSQTEIAAMVLVESLRQVNGLDLAAVLMRADYVKEIERTNAIANHPGGYTSRDEMARDQGISPTELSHTMDLVDVIFPFITERLGISVAQIWEEVGKSNLKEMIPVLKQIITGDESATQSVRRSADLIMDDVAATAQAAGQEIEQEEVQERAVAQLLENGALLTNRELRRHIRPERTAAINTSVIQVNGQHFVVFEANEEQMTLFRRRMGQYIDDQNVVLPDDPYQRATEAARIPELRSLVRLLEVE